MRPKDAQQEFDEEFKIPKNLPSKEEVEALMKENEQRFSEEKSFGGFDLVVNVMRRHGLTRSRAEELIRLFGG